MIKLEYRSTDEPLNATQKPFLKIPSIPLYRKHIQHAKKSRNEVLVHGYKYFSRVSAVGENTTATLKSISRCLGSKLILRFQFDPYLCEKSCLKDLCKTFKKIKGLRDFDVVFRRLDQINESDIVLPYIVKQIRLIKLRCEFPKTSNINDRGIINFARMLGKCASVKVFEEAIVDLENVSDSALLQIPKRGQKNIHLEEVYVKTHRLANLNAEGAVFIPPKTSIRPHKNVKKASLSLGISAGWFTFNPEASSNVLLDLKGVIILYNLEQLTTSFSGVSSVGESLSMFDVGFPHMVKLKYYQIEFLNCKISDMDIINLSQMLRKAPAIKHITIKVIQHPNISKDCIFFLVKTLLKFPILKRFDLYFRRLSLENGEIEELLESVSGLPQIKCTCFKNESLHLSLNLDENI